MTVGNIEKVIGYVYYGKKTGSLNQNINPSDDQIGGEYEAGLSEDAEIGLIATSVVLLLGLIAFLGNFFYSRTRNKKNGNYFHICDFES